MLNPQFKEFIKCFFCFFFFLIARMWHIKPAVLLWIRAVKDILSVPHHTSPRTLMKSLTLWSYLWSYKLEDGPQFFHTMFGLTVKIVICQMFLSDIWISLLGMGVGWGLKIGLSFLVGVPTKNKFNSPKTHFKCF